ncbi:MAG: ATP-binding cassette domain-containing protein [Tannerella sp.]|jgi:molybdate transport system ATP-binding protein|nr:ATP-binding cassette domain-containing protein [Tannerella sp.]
MNNLRPLTLSIERAVPALPEVRFAEPVQWHIREGEQWAVIGANGSGKSLLADLLQGRYVLKEGAVRFRAEGKTGEIVKSIAFKDIHSIVDSRNTYYQQRWHATETDGWPTAGELLSSGEDAPDVCEAMFTQFHIRESLSEKVIHLSSGEFRKFLIIRSLLSNPTFLVLDNPFIGLDAVSRETLVEMLDEIARSDKLQLILLLSNPSDIPEMITHVLPLSRRRCLPPQTRTAFLADVATRTQLFPVQEKPVHLPFYEEKTATHQVTFRMEQVCIRYGERMILNDICWEVKNGEKWALCGPNGSGKTLLLSLIYADNPQAYAQTLYLFDRKRGSGESIWDIKQRIGYVSPEMHLYYRENIPALNIVCSGFFDSTGLFRKCNDAQRQRALEWMRLFGIDALKDRSFLTLSSGEQRLTLLARAFVKNPDLLILDEPLHGLDISGKHRAARIIEAFCAGKGKTLIYVTHYPNELPACIDRRFELTHATIVPD